MSSWRFDLSRRRMTIFSPQIVGSDGDAEVHLLALADLELDAAVLREAALGDVERAHDLEAAERWRP
jgi:hypothetical protein